MIRVSSAFDGGNAELVDIAEDGTVRVRIRKDVGDRFLQWFYFRVTGARGVPLTVRIENAHEASYAKGYVDYHAVASTDRETWTRVPTTLAAGVLVIRHTPDADSVFYAYFAPYPMERHHALIARCLSDPRVHLEVLGATLDGQDLEMLHVGEGPRSIFVLARQHPGETMAEHWMEGFLARVLDEADPIARALLASATLHVVPNMNPDGSRRGHLRTNAAGENLNRAWLEPSLEASPEVFYVRQRMHDLGVDFCLDVHGDEELPYNFVAGPDGIPSHTPAQRALLDELRATLCALSPDFQREHGYPAAPPGGANLRLCTNYVAETFGCAAATLEMPFKDAANHPLPETGWSPARSRHLGAACVDLLRQLAPRLRD